MTSGKFKYNPETLEFESKERSKREKLLIDFLSILIGAIFIAVFIFFTFVLFFDMNIKKEKARENRILNEQYKKLLERKAQNDKYLKELIKKDAIIYQAVFKSMPDNSVFFNKNPYKKFSGEDIEKVIDNDRNRIIKDLAASKNEQKKITELLNIVKKESSEELRKIPAVQPVINSDFKYPVYGYGERIDQVYKSPGFHPGIDFAVPEGTAVFASADGKVEKAGRKRGMGKRIVINHGNGYKTVYAHLERINVKTGKKIKRGQKIGTVGMTGKTLISHLHYEIRFNDQPVNPVNYFFLDLNPQQYAKIISESEKSGLSLD